MCGGDAPGRLEEPTEVSVETTGQSTVVDPEQDKQKNQVLPTSDSGSDSTGGTSVAEEVAQVETRLDEVETRLAEISKEKS